MFQSDIARFFLKRLIDSISPDEILSFLTKLTDGTKQTTKRNRYSSLKSFFNYIKNSIDSNIQNLCDTYILRKIFKKRKALTLSIFDKELIDEIIFKTTNVFVMYGNRQPVRHFRNKSQNFLRALNMADVYSWILRCD
jgi:integrase